MTSRSTGKAALPCQTGTNDGLILSDIYCHPVTDGWQLGIRLGIVVNFAAEDDIQLIKVVFIDQQRAVADLVVSQQPGGLPAKLRVGFKLRRKALVPTEVCEGDVLGHKAGSRAQSSVS